MTVSQKAALSLLISVVLVAGFSVLAFTGFFNLIETRFYNPSITRSLSREVERDAETVQNFLDELQSRFSAAIEIEAVQRSFLPNQAAEDIFERTRAYGLLMESLKGLQSVRFVDAGGLRIHFSTSPADILTQTSETISYRNYDETAAYVPYPDLAVPSGGDPRITLDQQNERIIFSFPFYDAMATYRGTVFYALSVRAVAERLIEEGRIKIGEDLSIISVPPGMVSGAPHAGREVILPVISSIWSEGLLTLTALQSGSSPQALALVSAKTGQGLIVGRVVDEALFAFPQAIKVILLTAIFLTIFLTVFLGFNLRPDTMTLVQNRLKNLQLSLIREYYERKGEMDWNHWYRELEQRREDVRSELKRGTGKTAPALLEDIDSLIDKSWDEILTAIGGRRETRLAIDEDKLQNILNRMLLAAGTSPVLPGGSPPGPAAQGVMPLVKAAAAQAAAPGPAAVPAAPAKAPGPSGPVRPAAPAAARPAPGTKPGTKNIEVLDDVEELSEVEELGVAESAGTVDDVDDVEELAEVEELDAEDAVPAEDIPEAEAAGVPEDAGNLDDIDDIEELEELEELADLDEAAADMPEMLKAPVPAEDPASAADPGPPVDPVGEMDAAVIEEIEEIEDIGDIEETGDIDEAVDAIGAAALENAGIAEPEAAGAEDPHSGKSNIQLVFGDDDIPTIVETSGLELVDGSPAADEGELEELEELDEPESPRPAPVSVSESPSPPGEPDVASQIEFGASSGDEDVEDITANIEISSPFTNMLSRFDDQENFRSVADDTPAIKTSGRLETLDAGVSSMSLVHRPFQAEDPGEPEELPATGAGIIRQKNGVNYVDEKVKI
ncbi:MAG: hypothetical protein LBD09_00580, partial [Treponema sp.]|nr:hypothetical protein [Treponema sp.]